MWRHPALRLLSSDHHHALLLARMARHAAESLHPGVAERAWAQAAVQLTQELEPHLQVEEAVLLPAMEAAGEEALARRTREEHVALRALAAPVEPGGQRERLQTLATLLAAHTRFEEAELFPAAERLLSDAQLEAVHRACMEGGTLLSARAGLAQAARPPAHALRAEAQASEEK